MTAAAHRREPRPRTVLHEAVDSTRADRRAGTPGPHRRPRRDRSASGLRHLGLRRGGAAGSLSGRGGPRLFEHFPDRRGPLRRADDRAQVRSLGFASERLPSRTFQGTPMRHRGVHVGNVYLVEKEGGEEFTGKDEEVLRPFASQAPRAIANARTCRDERRARAGLEALVETSPVGVAVFDAQTGRPVSFYREARRTVESPRTPGRSPEHPLQAMT